MDCLSAKTSFGRRLYCNKPSDHGEEKGMFIPTRYDIRCRYDLKPGEEVIEYAPPAGKPLYPEGKG